MYHNYTEFEFTSTSYLILMDKEIYLNEDGEWIPAPTETEREVVSPEFYTNYITSIPFFDSFDYGAPIAMPTGRLRGGCACRSR